MTQSRQAAKAKVMQYLAMAAHRMPPHSKLLRKVSDAFDEYCALDPAQVPVRQDARSVCLHCGKPYEEVVDGP